MKINLKNIILVTITIAVLFILHMLYKAQPNNLPQIIALAILNITILIAAIINKKEVIIKEKIITKTITKTQQKQEETNTNKQTQFKIDPYTKKQDYKKYIETQLRKLAKQYEIDQAIYYIKNKEKYYPVSTYAYFSDKLPEPVEEGDGLVGQVIKEKQLLNLENIPEDYLVIFSGLGKTNPKTLLIIPAVINDNVIAVVEMAFLKNINKTIKNELKQAIHQISENVFDVI
jgi:hypothetical protein